MLASHGTNYSADSVEVRPGAVQTFACATYQLDSSTDTRNGDVALLRYDLDEKLIKEVDIVETGGVLDMFWRDRTTLLAAKASGELQVLKVSESDKLESLHSLELSDSILLAVDGHQDTLTTSDTTGNIYILDSQTFSLITSLPQVHGARGWGAEVWGLAISPHSPDLVYTGGDDCLLKCTDTRAPCTVFTSAYHEMGVCCISPDPRSEHVILSGSYDESLVAWDCRDTRQPVCSVSVGGGVWRARRSPANTHVLVAGMHSGFHVVDLSSFKVTKSYDHGHESLAYGAGWLQDGVVATCSFYDNLVTVWDSGVVEDDVCLTGS